MRVILNVISRERTIHSRREEIIQAVNDAGPHIGVVMRMSEWTL